MLAFSNDYYGFIFRVTQSVELFCTYEVSVIKKENVALLNVSYDMDRVVAVLGKNKVKEAIEVAKHLGQENAKQNIKKKRIDRDGR